MHPIPRSSISGRSRVLSPPVTSAGFGKRPAPGFSFIKSKKKKQMNLVKDFTFSSLDEEGQMVMLFPISINLNELLERFGQLSVSIVCSAIEQELRDQGEVVRLVVLDARGQPIMDSSHTRSKLLYSVYSFFVPAILSSFCFSEKETVGIFVLLACNDSVSSKHHYPRNFSSTRQQDMWVHRVGCVPRRGYSCC